MVMGGTNFVVRREALMRVGGLCHCTADDMDLSLKIKMSGGKVAIMREVTAVSEVTSTYMALKAQNIRWSSNDSIILRRYAGRILRSKMSIVDKMDLMLWLTKYPLLSLGGLSIFISIILSVFGIILPPPLRPSAGGGDKHGAAGGLPGGAHDRHSQEDGGVPDPHHHN